MTEHADWRGDYAEKELAVLKGQLQLYWNYIDSPVMRSFHITQPIREEFLERFGHMVKDRP